MMEAETWTNAPVVTSKPLTLEDVQTAAEMLRRQVKTLPCLECQRQMPISALRLIELGSGVNGAGAAVDYFSQECTDQVACKVARRRLFIERVPPEFRRYP